MNSACKRSGARAMLLLALLLLAGCASISEYTKVYLGTPTYPPTNPAAIQILSAEPKRPTERLGEIMLDVDGTPSRERLEHRLKAAAAKLGANAVFVVYDKIHVFPVVYVDWWGPTTMGEDLRRNIVAVAVKYK
jgi:hypothetical protein